MTRSRTESTAIVQPLPVDEGELQVGFRPAPSLDDDPAFVLWAIPELDRRTIAERLRAWGASVQVRRLRRVRLELRVPALTPGRHEPRLETVAVVGHALRVGEAIEGLVALHGADEPAHREPSASASAWSSAVKLALELVARERLVPVLRPHDEGRHADARWAVSISHPSDRARFEVLAGAMPPAACALAAGGRPQDLLRRALDVIADEIVRTSLARRREQQSATGADIPSKPPTLGAARLPGAWEERFVTALTEGPPLFIPYGLGESRLIDELARWARPALGAGVSEFAACFRLDPPSGDRGGRGAARDGDDRRDGARRGDKRGGARRDGERRGEAWALSYWLHCASDTELRIPARRVWEAREDELVIDGRTVQAPQEILLRDLAEAARVFAPIGESLDETHPTGVELTGREAWYFLSEAAPLLEEVGLWIEVPESLSLRGTRRLRPRLRVWQAAEERPARSTRTKAPPPGGAGSRLGVGELARFRWEAAIGDDTLTPEEFKELASLQQPLVRWRGEWLVLEPEVVAQLRRLLRSKTELTMSRADALRAVLTGTAAVDSGAEVEVVASRALEAWIARLRRHGFADVTTPDGFHGTLRPYQRRGLRWLAGMADLGLGACLADDMGLGKTIQLLALLLHDRRVHPEDQRPAIVVCPASVLGNWQREAERFAPELPVHRHHGAERARTVAQLKRMLAPNTVVLTTYALARRDRAMLSRIDWSFAVLDEAQYVKNPGSQQARAVRSLNASHRVALTGTPIENRLAELWSILEFLNPALLGSIERFRREVAIPIERYRDREAEKRLTRLTGPFLLRRLKTDPRVIRDLPEKLEMTVHCSLTREQASLYQAALDELLEQIEGSRGMSRRGLILKLITSLKQICNHPAHFLRTDDELTGRSGKLERLLDMIEEACAEGDRSLVYTQYREMGKLLVQALNERLGHEVPFLHGAVPLGRRDELVREFQEEVSPPVFVLSLRAGGTGLNLTAANRVFHFDRWWNPAVEDQATDRAFRIGQTRNVQVHKMLTIGTLEERIDQMLVEKRDLADRIVGTGEAWLTELSNNELRDLFSLSHDAVVEDRTS